MQRVDRKPEIGLRAGHHPVQIALLSRMQRLGPGQAGLAAVLDAAASGNLALDFQLQVEVLRDQVLAPDIRVVNDIVFAGFANDCAVLNAPNRGVALPVREALAIEDLGKARVVAEVHRGRLMKLRANRWRSWLGRSGRLGGDNRGASGQQDSSSGTGKAPLSLSLVVRAIAE